MKSDWEIKSITSIVEFNPKHSIKKGTVVPYVEMAAIPEYNREIAYFEEREFKSGSKFTNGDTLFSRITPCLQNGKTSRVSGLEDNQVANGSTEFIVMSAKDVENDKDFVYYLSLDKEFRKYAEGRMEGTTGRQRVSWQALSEYELPIPPKEDRKKIAHILSTLDDKIELNRKMNQTLEEMAQALFKSWFVDFDPVHAKMGCANDEELERAARELGISKEVLELFPSEFKESELGMIPKGWEVKPLSSITEILNGHAFKSKDYVENGTFVLRTKNFDNDGYVANSNDDVYLPSSFLESHSKFICEAYDFHLVMVGASIGKTSMILPINLPALRNQNMWCFRPKEGFVSKVFINALVKNVVKIQMGFANGSAREFFTKGNFFNQEVLVPLEKVLENYDMLTMPLLEKINNNQAQIQTLQKTRDTLLPKLLSGELDVSELELDIN